LSNLDNLIVIQETENKKLKEGTSPRWGGNTWGTSIVRGGLS
jgi:hypothetical protein